MNIKDSSYVQTSSFRSSSPHIGPTKTLIMTEGTSQRDQAGGMEREFKRGKVLVKVFSHLVTCPSSPWRRLEIADSLQDWLEAWKDFFCPDSRIHHTIEAERQRALGEIAASMRRPPAPSSARLSTEAGGGFPTHGLAPDQPSPLPPTPNHVPGPVPEGFEDEPPSPPNPVPGPVLEGFMDESPPHPDPVPSSVPEGSQAEPPSHSVPVCEGLVDGLPPLPAPVPSPILEGSEDKLPPSLVPVPEEFVDELSPLPVPVPEGCEDAPSPPAVSRRLCRRSPQPHRMSQRSLRRSPGFLQFPHCASELLRGFSWSCRQPPDRQPLCRRPLTASPFIAGLLINCSCVADLQIACSVVAARLNSGSAGDCLRAGRLNSCPPSETPSAHPGRVVLFFCFFVGFRF
ncbi:hypothetical protein ATANTOWER_007520 [Ataeniobius toweri]|uniref:Uncharacterized protein n=1 Tax=Ataeniobius toweri TaxID=208326 RepID=A0ABU7A4X5_9TELE|nr:hypothetical protein [Ataeniobius toweri]